MYVVEYQNEHGLFRQVLVAGGSRYDVLTKVKASDPLFMKETRVYTTDEVWSIQ